MVHKWRHPDNDIAITFERNTKMGISLVLFKPKLFRPFCWAIFQSGECLKGWNVERLKWMFSNGRSKSNYKILSDELQHVRISLLKCEGRILLDHPVLRNGLFKFSLIWVRQRDRSPFCFCFFFSVMCKYLSFFVGLQSLKAAALNAQKKKESQQVCQADNVGYTGTLKTVIKIHRQEKKGHSKSPMKMIYKASSSSSSISGLNEEPNNSMEVDVESASKDVSWSLRGFFKKGVE